MDPAPPQRPRGGEGNGENGCPEKKRKIQVQEQDPEDKQSPVEERVAKKRMGRPPNKPPVTLTVPVHIAPRPGPRQVGRDRRYAPEEENLVVGSSGGTLPDLAANIIGAAPAVVEDDAPPVVPQMIDIMPLNQPDIIPDRPCTTSRGHYPPVNSHPATRHVEMKIRCYLDRQAMWVSIDHAVINAGFTESFVNPKDLWWMDLPIIDLEPHEIRTIVTPRGLIRCTRAVVLSFTFPQLNLPMYDFRTLVLPDDHPDPEVTVIIGQSWDRELGLSIAFQTLAPYVSNAFAPYVPTPLESLTPGYPGQSPFNVLSADYDPAAPRPGLEEFNSDE